MRCTISLVLLCACLLAAALPQAVAAPSSPSSSSTSAASGTAALFPAGAERPYMRRQTADGMTQFIFFERAPYTWLRDEHGQRVGLCRDGRCAYFVDCLEESCPVPLVDVSDVRLVTVNCLYSADTASAGRGGNVEQPHSSALGDSKLTPLGQNNIFTGQTDGGVRASLPNAGKRPDGSFSAAVKEFLGQLTLEDCLKKLSKVSISSEWMKKGIAIFVALGIVVHAMLLACEMIDRIGNWLLDAAAAGLGRLWRRVRRRFGHGDAADTPAEDAVLTPAATGAQPFARAERAGAGENAADMAHDSDGSVAVGAPAQDVSAHAGQFPQREQAAQGGHAEQTGQAASEDGRLHLRPLDTQAGGWDDDMPLGDGSAPDAPRPAGRAPHEKTGWLAKLRRLLQNF